MEKKTIATLIAIGIVAVIALVVAVVSLSGGNKPLGGAAYESWNVMQTSMNFVSANTSATLPTRLIAGDSNRQYAAVCNNSDTSLYIYLDDFASALLASTTVSNYGGGIRLNANGGCYEILPENMWIGQIWVATATTKNIIVTYK